MLAYLRGWLKCKLFGRHKMVMLKEYFGESEDAYNMRWVCKFCGRRSMFYKRGKMLILMLLLPLWCFAGNSAGLRTEVMPEDSRLGVDIAVSYLPDRWAQFIAWDGGLFSLREMRRIGSREPMIYRVHSLDMNRNRNVVYSLLLGMEGTPMVYPWASRLCLRLEAGVRFSPLRPVAGIGIVLNWKWEGE